jgi:Ca2+-binding RTX toxin-like protein
MATLDLTRATQGIDMQDNDLVAFDTVNSAFATQWSWITPDGHDIDLGGSGLTYDANGRALTGTVTSIAIDLGNDNFSDPDIFVTGINADAKLLDNNAANFWSFLSGDDTFLGPLIENGGTGFSRLFGDALRAPASAAEGGDDLFRAGDTSIHVAGDVFDVNTGATFTGGNDRIFGAPTEQSQGLSGDAFTVQGTGVLIGGDDIMAIRSVDALSFAFGDAATVHGFGGLAKVAGGDDRIIAEDGSAAKLSGDVGTVVENALVTGGDDTIGGSERGEAITGDVFTMLSGSGVEITGGDDTLNGKGGNDIISGDVHVSQSGGIITGGNDTIDGGEGADRIFGEIAAGNASSTGGNDQLFGDAGDDQIFGQSGSDRLNGGLSGDVLDGGSGIDTLDYAGSNAGVTVKLSQGTASGGHAEGDSFRNAENLTGSSFADTLSGDAGANLINGSAGNDTLVGGGGNDRLFGSSGQDVVNGGTGRDELSGGGDSDRFDFAALADSAVGPNRDAILDFAVDPATGAGFIDRINVSSIDAQAAAAGNQAFGFIGASQFSAEGQIRAIQVGDDTVVQFNTAGADGAEMELLLRNFTATNLEAVDFIL